MNQISLFEDEGQVSSLLPEWVSFPEDCRTMVIRAIAILLCRMGLTQEGSDILE